MMKLCKQISVATLLLLFLFVPNTLAVTFNTHYIGGTAPANAVGGGNMSDIINAATRLWASAYSNQITITLYYGWAEIGDAGTHTLLTQGGNPNREISGLILFDNSGSVAFYMDANPNDNEEYQRYTEQSQNFGGGLINVARIFGSPTGAAVGRVDLFSVALHEIGHALGMSSSNASFISQSGSGVIIIPSGLPYEGTMVPLAYNNSGIIPHIDVTEVAYGSVMAGVNGDERRMPSELDIVANAQVSRFTILNLRPQQISQSSQTPTASSTRSRLVTDPRSISVFERAAGTKKVSGYKVNRIRLPM